MSADLTSQVFEGQMVRVVLREGEPWFVGKDVCAALGFVNHNQALGRLDDDERGVCNVDPPRTGSQGGGAQELIVISESGVYDLVYRSRKPQAARFRRWVRKEVLPAIRKTGRYEGPVEPTGLTLEAVQETIAAQGKADDELMRTVGRHLDKRIKAQLQQITLISEQVMTLRSASDRLELAFAQSMERFSDMVKGLPFAAASEGAKKALRPEALAAAGYELTEKLTPETTFQTVWEVVRGVMGHIPVHRRLVQTVAYAIGREARRGRWQQGETQQRSSARPVVTYPRSKLAAWVKASTGDVPNKQWIRDENRRLWAEDAKRTGQVVPLPVQAQP